MGSDNGTCRIALDAMGGDHAPHATLDGARQALEAWPGLTLLLVGDETRLREALPGAGLSPHLSRLEVVPSTSVVEFHDEPSVILKEKKDSSIRVAAQLVREGRADAMVSMGHTGAAMMASTLVIKKLEGVERPGLAALMPSAEGKPTVFIEVGASIDSRPDHIVGFAIMGAVYAEQMLGIENPRVGVMSIGEEETKGTEVTLEVARRLKETDLNFKGNAEGRDLWNGSFDVIVCDGFLGNIVLKSAEGLAKMVGTGLKNAMTSGLRAKLGGWLVRPSVQDFFKQLDYREYGGLPLLGIKGVSVIGHGSSNGHAVKNGIGAALRAVEGRLHERIQARLAQLAPKD